MENVREFKGMFRRLLIFAVAVSVGGCGSVGSSAPDPSAQDDDSGGNTTDTSAARVYESAGGTSGLSIGAADTGTAALKSFDPGAFVRTATATEAAASEPPAQQDAPPPAEEYVEEAPPPEEECFDCDSEASDEDF